MNFRMIGQVVGRVLCIEAALMLLPMIAALVYDESPVPFLITIAVTGGIGLVMWRVRAKSGGITARDGFLIVGLSWIAMSLFGALLFVLTGDIPNYVDALFETISGLTTTGASVVTSPESMTRGGMFWRLFTHWIGGMGILVFVLAVLPMSGNRSMHIMRAEVPGPTVGKLVPRIRKTASILYLLYIALTLVETVLLVAGGMSFYDALLHAFATAGTGGLSTRALSIGYYNSAYIDIVVGVFMILFGANFSLYYLILLGNIRTALRNEELRWFLGIIAFAVLTIAVDIRNLYGGVGHALRYSFFQVTSIISTTGFATADFNDGMAIARAVLEYCADPRRLGAKTMFATHYHELTALEQTLPGVRNYNITAKKQGGTLLFLRKIVAGAADDSYGIEVAKLAGVPDAIITKAKTYLRELESGAAELPAPARAAEDAAQMTLGDAAGDEIAEQLRGIDLNTITPLEAMRLLFELQQKARG